MKKHSLLLSGLVLLLAQAICGPVHVWAADDGQAARRLPPGCTPWAKKGFLHPPLKCMAEYLRIDEYPVSTWCFHGLEAAKAPYCDEYVERAKAVGFNVLIDDERIIPYAEKVGGVKVMLAIFYLKPADYAKRIFDNEKVGDSEALLGFILGDNQRGLPDPCVQTANWMKEKYPHLIPVVSRYPSRIRAGTPIRVLCMQNYPYLRGHRGSKAAAAYMSQCESDRLTCNKNDMAMWQCFGGTTPFYCVRLQMMAGLAYGAQGLSHFCYAPHRIADYEPASKMIPKWHALNQYVIKVLGRHVWGTRCMGVLHGTQRGRPAGADGFDSGQLVVRASNYLMVGLLTPEKRFLSKRSEDRAVPEYFMVVDKRTGRSGGTIRDSFVMLSDKVPAVEVIDRAWTKDVPTRRIVPGFKIQLNTQDSDGLLLRIAPDMAALLGGAEGVGLYGEINRTMAALQWKAMPPAEAGKGKEHAELAWVAVDPGEIGKAVKAAEADVARLEKVLAGAVAKGTVSQAQVVATLKNLKDSMKAAAAEAGKGRPGSGA